MRPLHSVDSEPTTKQHFHKLKKRTGTGQIIQPYYPFWQLVSNFSSSFSSQVVLREYFSAIVKTTLAHFFIFLPGLANGVFLPFLSPTPTVQ